jgi:hypothetical protein
MALQKSITTPSGITLSTAYGRVCAFQWSGAKLRVDFVWFATQAAREANLQPVEIKTYHLDLPATGDIRAQAYDQLKLLPDFATAVDC